MRVFTRWDEVSTSCETDELLSKLALVHLNRICDPVLKMEVGSLLQPVLDLKGLCAYEVDYTAISTSDALNLRQILAFYSKRSDIDLGVSRLETAVRTFIDSEDLCRETNDILRQRKLGKFLFLPGVESLLFKAQHKIAKILGDVPSLTDLSIRFGPGATTQVKRRKSHPRRKLSVSFACSEDMVETVGRCLEEMPSWVFDEQSDSDLDSKKVSVHIHDGNLVFVPKNAKTHRPVVVEPSLNTMFQAGIGTCIAKRLRLSGIDIRDQSRNKALAREGSITGGLATLDLSSASDTISKELVYDLLPIDWSIFMARFRTGHVKYESVRLHLEKFSSMGNGYTFPLETLIFYALACACVDDQDQSIVSVYGDDIIVPTYAYEKLSFLLGVVGFKPNAAKSFSSGPFRESCGGDYLRGIDIRPCYIKGPLACFDVFRLHNFYARAKDDELAFILTTYLSQQIKIYGPDGYGDGHLLGEHHLRPHGRKHGWSGYVFETFTFRPRKEMAVLPGDRVYPFYSTYASSFGEEGFDTRRSLLRESAFEFASQEGPDSYHLYRNGLLVTTLPGVKSYNRIKIYVLG